MIPLVLITMASLIGSFLIWWLIFETEGAYLGRRVVIWLYDLYAGRYDAIKEQDPMYEHILLAQPIMHRIAPHQNPLVLDVATGTGRLPLALHSHAIFDGYIIGLDLSRKMLHQASQNLQQQGIDDYVTLIWQSAERLPFPDNTFDVVTCLEALEFMPDRHQALAELCRVLRPGGTLLITNRIHTPWMPGRLWTEKSIIESLQKQHIESIEFELWEEDYMKVWGQKAGASELVGVRLLDEILLCPHCSDKRMTQQGSQWVCEDGTHAVRIGDDRVIEYHQSSSST